MMKYAVINLQGHQYIVSEWVEIVVDNLDVEDGKPFFSDQVLTVFSEDASEFKLGAPTVTGAKVEFEVKGTQKGEKITVLKFQNKKRYTKKAGFRPLQTTLIVKKITS